MVEMTTWFVPGVPARRPCHQRAPDSTWTSGLRLCYSIKNSSLRPVDPTWW